MNYFYRLNVVALLFVSTMVSAEIIKKEASYIGDLVWQVDDLIIRQTDIVNSEEYGPFVKIKTGYGKLRIFYQNDEKQSDLSITTDEGIKNSIDPSYTSVVKAYEFLNGSKPLKVYLLKKQMTQKMLELERQVKNGPRKTNHTGIFDIKEMVVHNMAQVKYFEMKRSGLKPSPYYENVVAREYRITFKWTGEVERDYQNILRPDIKNARIRNFFTVAVSVAFIWLVWFLFKKIKLASSEAVRKSSTKLKEIKDKKYQTEIRKIAEATAISETVKNEMKMSEPEELAQLRTQISVAIEMGDHDKADTLLKLAERLKKLGT